jgi:site-specific DNA recombinase
VERRIAKLVEALADGMPVRAVKDELVRLEGRQDELKRQIEQAPQGRPVLLHPNLAEVYRTKVADLHRALEDGDTMAEAMDLIRSLVDAIVLTPEDGKLRIDLRGELAGILALCADKRKPGSVSGVGLAEQVKLVAGARNHRDLTLPPIIV